MLCSCTLLFLFSTTSSAVFQGGYEDGKEYIYQISSQTLVSLNIETGHTSGIFITARLALHTNGSDRFRAKITQPRYAQIHTELDSGADVEISPEDWLNLTDFPISEKPFDVEMKDGMARDLIVDANTKTWEINFLKSIISQLQVGTLDENVTTTPEWSLNAPKYIRRTENSLTGSCEVLYMIRTVSEHDLQCVLEPMPQLNKNDTIISVEKTRDYSKCEHRVGYHFNINGRNKFEPGSNENGKFLSRSANGRMIISGGLQKYIIQMSTITNRVTINPDQEGNQAGMLVSKIKLTLAEVKEITNEFGLLSNPVRTGNLIYDTSNPLKNVRARCLDNPGEIDPQQGQREPNNSCNRVFYPKPKLSEAPRDSKIPHLLKDRESSNKTSAEIDIIRVVKEIAQLITSELSRPCPALDDQPLEKFATLIQLIRSMSAKEISEVQHELFELSESQESRKNTWIIFKDAVAQAGTGPALVSVKRMIDEKQIRAEEAAFDIDAVAKSARTPTLEYVETYFEIAQTAKVRKDFVVHNAAIISFAELTRHAIVNDHSARNRYPVDSYGLFFKPIDKNVMDKYIEYMAQELSKSVDLADSRQILVYIQALGRTADPRIMNVFEPYLRGEKNITQFQRLSIALALDKFSEVKKKVAQPFLYALYTNTSLPCDVRTAIVYMLMKTKPPANMLQSMANDTHNDNCKQVNSAIKSSIVSLAQIQSPEQRDLVDAAKSALPLLGSETFGILKSRVAFKDEKDSKSHTGTAIMAYDIGDDESVVPKEATLLLNPTFEGLKLTKIKLESAISNPLDFLERAIEIKNEILFNQTTRIENQKKYSKRLEGYTLIDYFPRNLFWAFDDDTLKEEVRKYIRRLYKSLTNGDRNEETKFTNYEVTLKFPTETGFPLVFRLEAPKFIRAKLNTSLNDDTHDGKKFASRESMNIIAKLDILYGSKFQKRLSFSTFFDRQEYVTGVDKNMQVRIPLSTEIQYDFGKKQTKIAIHPIKEDQHYDIIQFKKQPFSTKRDLLDFAPINIYENNLKTGTGFVDSSGFDLKGEDQQPYLLFNWTVKPEFINNFTRREGKSEDDKLEVASNLLKSIVAMIYPREFQKLKYEEYSVKILPTINVSAEVVIAIDNLIHDSNDKENESSNCFMTAQTSFSDARLSKEERKQRMLNRATENINMTIAKSVDVSFRLSNKMLSFDSITAFARDAMEKKSEVLFYASARAFDGGDYYLSADFKTGHYDFQDARREKSGENHTQCEYQVEIISGRINDNTERSEKLMVRGKI